MRPARGPSMFCERTVVAIERGFDLKREAWELLDLIVAEWTSDPQSVACFDRRIVERAKAAVAEYKTLPEIAR